MMRMKQLTKLGMIAALVLTFARFAAAQGGAAPAVTPGAAAPAGAPQPGVVWDSEGKLAPGVKVTIKEETSGQTLSADTDKDGKFSIPGVPDGTYLITVTGPQMPAQGFNTRATASTPRQPWPINIKALEAMAKANPELTAFNNMKDHFSAASAAMTDAETLRKSLTTAPADQKADIKSKLSTDYDKALTEYTAAEQAVGPKDTGNHAVIWWNIGKVNDYNLKYSDAAAAYQKAIDLRPTPDYYVDLGTALVNAGAAQRDPAVLEKSVADANAACEKAAAPAPAPAGGAAAAAPMNNGARCYKNMGIVLSNKGDSKQAIEPLQKATTANPKDAAAWFLLGGAYAGMIESKTVGDKEVFTVPPGTVDAYQKCVDADPNGPYAGQCKEMIDSVNQMSGGQSTQIGTAPKKAPPPKKKN